MKSLVLNKKDIETKQTNEFNTLHKNPCVYKAGIYLQPRLQIKKT